MFDSALDLLTDEHGEWNVLAVTLAAIFWALVATGIVAFALWAANDYATSGAGVAGF